MSRYVFKLPDLGEGTVASEIVSWRVQVGDVVAEDAPLVELATDKAVLEVPSPVSGRVLALHGEPGDSVAVGSDLVIFETEETLGAVPPTTTSSAVTPTELPVASVTAESRTRVMAAPATRRLARQAGIDLAQVTGSGPRGRIARADLQRSAEGQSVNAPPLSAGGRRARTGVEEVKIIGVRRVIAERTLAATRNIPHFSYVEEVDVTALEALRLATNASLASGVPGYSYLPFVLGALALVLVDFPQCNAHYDEERKVLMRHRGVHVGIATQTDDGLKVPVVRHVEALGLASLADQIRLQAAAARDGTAKRADLSGSTITVTSLGKLGGVASTPVLNAPEVAIIGVNKAVDRPMVVDGHVVIRRMMNLSSSFDHRFVDGFDAAAMIQALKERLEQPASIFEDLDSTKDSAI
jgi:2-oxoisovalerate dehydrogenase E2 component (dihydrolipoyl transacylase)